MRCPGRRFRYAGEQQLVMEFGHDAGLDLNLRRDVACVALR